MARELCESPHAGCESQSISHLSSDGRLQVVDLLVGWLCHGQHIASQSCSVDDSCGASTGGYSVFTGSSSTYNFFNGVGGDVDGYAKCC